MATVYLIHFERPYHHAQHYLGLTRIGIERRLERHKGQNGARLLRAVQQAGIDYSVVRTWEGEAALERQLKSRKCSRVFCPVCTAERKKRKA